MPRRPWMAESGPAANPLPFAAGPLSTIHGVDSDILSSAVRPPLAASRIAPGECVLADL